VIYISYGLPRSGSTFAANIAEQTLNLASVKSNTEIGSISEILSNISSRFVATTEELEQIIAGAQQEKLYFVKCHCAPSSIIRKAFEEQRAAGHATYRHPGDMVVSLMDAYTQRPQQFPAGKTFEQAVASYQSAFRNFEMWRQLPHIIPVSFESFTTDSHEFAYRIGKQIGVTLSDEDLTAVIGNANTQFHQFNVGQSGRHCDVLTDRQNFDIQHTFSTLIALCSQSLNLSMHREKTRPETAH